MDWLRLYLLAGLAAHKILWSWMKRKSVSRLSRSPVQPFAICLVKGGKIAILVALLAQTMLPDLLPISTDSQPLRVAGFLLYTVGLLIAVVARLQLGQNWLDIEVAEVKHHQFVVCSGLYALIRHPIYIGDLILVIGLELALNSRLAIVAIMLVPLVLRQAIKEELMLIERLPGYDLYCRRTKRFLPYIV